MSTVMIKSAKGVAMTKNRIRFSLKGVLLTMGLLAMISGLFGCKKNPEPDIPGPDDEFGIVGNDYSMDGPGEYKEIVGCRYRVNGYGPGFTYEINKSEDGRFVLEYENREEGIEDLFCEVDAATMEELARLCEKLNILSWDKFDMSANGVLDGSGFDLSIEYADGTHIRASGDNCFPKNYNEFEKGIAEVLAPAIGAERARIREEKYKTGAYSGKLEFAMINYSGRGASGSDSYSFLIRNSSSNSTKAEMTVKSASGEFIESGKYSFRGDPENIDDLLAELQAVLEKYNVYKWDGYDKSTPDYNDREWFQLSFDYAEASINCCGCGDTEHYDEVRKEILEILIAYMKDYMDEKGQ